MYSSRSIAIHRAAVTSIVLLAVGLALVQARAFWLARLSVIWPYADLAYSVYAGVLALALSWNASRRPDARTGALTYALLALFLSLVSVPSRSASIAHEITFSVSCLWLVMAVRFSMIFPSEISLAGLESLMGAPSHKSRRVRLWNLVARTQAFAVTHPAVLWALGAIVLAWSYIHTTRLASRGYLLFTASLETLPLMIVVGISVLSISLSFLWTGYRLANEEERKKILWVVLSGTFVIFWAILLGVLTSLAAYTDAAAVSILFEYLRPAFLPVSWFVPLTGMAVAILYSGAFDVRPLINKTTVYGTLSVLFIVLFGVIESLVSEVVEARLGLPDMVGAAVSGGIVAAIVLPLRGRFSSIVSRLLP